MKLYFSPGACSLAPHIALREAELDVELIRVDLASHQLDDGSDYYQINSKGAVPMFELDNGERLTEGVAIMQYIADLVPQKNLAPANGTFARSRLHENLNFIATEIHKTWGVRFNPKADPVSKGVYADRLLQQYSSMNQRFSEDEWLLGKNYSVADMYLFVTTFWSNFLPLDLSEFNHLNSFIERMSQRPAVQAAMKAEGLI
ncbi:MULTISPECIES: glutathione transferase GstA [unclassified Microbulbifer]|uniref:glutathione transferase GstA n=1 Tax=unclassified Microbulbifer TaxID=2619833 RepID=UPI0027E5B41C|nr:MULTISPECIES: glutathione transferase GstA [unclassified Microbulbifer]